MFECDLDNVIARGRYMEAEKRHRDAMEYASLDLSQPEITALLNMIDHHIDCACLDAAPDLEMAALTRARKKLEQER
jgi:hypothetical protein